MPHARQSDTPVPGWYLIRLVRGGPWVGCEIIQHEDGQWSCMLDGEMQGPSANPWLLSNLSLIHHWGRESSETEVKYRLALKRHEEVHNPGGYAANPRQRINLDEIIPY